jgi:flagellar hook-basal body complex protein FliE
VTIPIAGIGAGWSATATTAPAGAATSAAPATTSTAASSATAGTSSDFGSMLSHGLQGVQDAQTHADQLAVKASTGDLTDVHDYMIASTQATLMTELTVAVRNKAVEAFNDIMRMPM